MRLFSTGKPTALEWVCLAAGLFFALRYSWLLDDAFVYFRYVDNLLFLGHGLVYNAGEYVEGFTSPLWLLLVTLLRVTTMDYWLIVRLVAVASFAVFWWMLVVLNRVLSPKGAPVVNLPLVLLTFNYAVACYFTSGVEAPLVQVAAVAYALFVVQPNRVFPAVIVAVSPLIRPELTLTFAIVTVWAWFRARRACALLVLAGGGTLGAWLLFRVWYYADLFPNTFYLKDLDDFAQGWTYLQQTLATYWTHPILLAFAIGMVVLRRRGVDIQLGKRLLLLGLAALIAAYFVRIGGDPRHYRYLAFSFCLTLAAMAGLAEHALVVFAPRMRAPAASGAALGVGIVVACCYPPQLASHPMWGECEHRHVDKIADAAAHRYHADLAASPWQLAPRFDQFDRYAEYLRERADGPPYDKIWVGAWCVKAYRRFDKRVINDAGLTDAILARTEMAPDRPGHKFGLTPLALEMAALMAKHTMEPGMFRRTVESGEAPQWIADNLATIEVIERKIYNTHDLLENLRLAFTFPPRIQP